MTNKIKNISTKKKFTIDSLIGFCMGSIEVLLLHPFSFFKNLSQQKLKYTFKPKIIYRGVGMGIIDMGIMTAIQYPLTNYIYKTVFDKNSNKSFFVSENKKKIISSFSSGMLSGFVCSPMELVIVQQQRWGGNIINTIYRISKNFGSKTLM